MNPIEFPEQTIVLRKPAGMSEDECGPLPVFRNGEQCISCWRPSWRELLQLLVHRRIWLGVFFDDTQPPVWLETKRPFVTPPPPARAPWWKFHFPFIPR